MNDLIMLRVAATSRNSPRLPFDPHACRAERIAAGLRLTDFASVCGASARTVERWEKGETVPNAQALVRVERVLAVLTAVVSIEAA